MGKVLPALDDNLIAWIGRQHLFFVATAPDDGGHVNVSPKGLDTLRILDPNTVAYLDLTGSGAETIAHVRENQRITLMMCAFDGAPNIVRLFGRGAVHPIGSAGFDELRSLFPDTPGSRAVIAVRIDRVQTSCGYAVPRMDFVDDRPTLNEWAERRGPEGLAEYWATRNAWSIDGLPALDPPAIGS